MQPNLESELVELLDAGVIFDRSKKPIRPTVTLVASVRNKDRENDARHFVRELWGRYPNARLVLTDKSPVEKAAVEMAELLEMPVEIVRQAPKGEWDHGSNVQDERVVSKASHVVLFDDSARCQNYRKLASRTLKFIQST